MQDKDWVDDHLTELLAPGQVPLMRLEIEVGAGNWIDLCDLDSKNYVESISGSLGGASMTPNPVGGALSAELSNEDSIFHPKHPDSGYEDYLKTGRKVRIWLGGTYGGVDKYWQRMIGYIDEPRFEALAQKVSISGADYMKLLEDAEFGGLDNYWGLSKTFDSISSDGYIGIELYNEADAMDITGELPNVTNWSDHYCQFTWVDDTGGDSLYAGKAVVVEEPPTYPYIKNDDVFIPEANTEYKFSFKYNIVSGPNPLSVIINQYTNGQYVQLAEKTNLREHTYTDDVIYFRTQGTGKIEIRFIFYTLRVNDEFRVDQFSIWKFVPYEERYYELPVGAKGPFRVLLKQNAVWEDVWQGEEDEGWGYEEDTRRVAFDINKTVGTGTDNLVIHYFTAESPENALADILVKVKLYADRTAALTAMGNPNTGISIDRIWFDAGSPYLNAIKKICERCDYRFHFSYAGIPVFKPKPAPAETAFTFTDQKHIASFSNYQDRNEVKNRIVIEGMKQAEPVNKEETLPPELRGVKSDDISIGLYGERTLTIKNHLFQDQDSILNEAGNAGMCVTLLAEYKIPKWYSDVEIPFCAVPLELGDEMGWKERLSTTQEVPQTGIIRDIKIDNFNTIYKCQII